MLGTVAMATSYHASSVGMSRLQASLDSAVLAGAATIEQPDLAASVATRFMAQNFAAGATADTELVSQSYQIQGQEIVGTAAGRTINPFGNLPGLPSRLEYSVRAKAVRETSPVCILGLNALDKGAMDMNGTSRLVAPTCAVQINSSDASGLTQEGAPFAEVRRVRVHGGFTGIGYSSKPESAADVIADPYASSLRSMFPRKTPCQAGSGTLHIKTNTTLAPGTYCGGIHITSQASVMMLPGTYIMDGGPLWVNGGATLVGNDVMIAFSGPDSTLYAEGNSTINLTSQRIGPYRNIQFFEDPKQYVDPKKGLYFSIGGGRNNNSEDTSKVTIDGMIYTPNQQIWIFGKADTSINSPTMAIVTEKLWIQGRVTLTVANENKRGLSVGTAPVHVTTALRLSQ